MVGRNLSPLYIVFSYPRVLQERLNTFDTGACALIVYSLFSRLHSPFFRSQ